MQSDCFSTAEAVGRLTTTGIQKDYNTPKFTCQSTRILWIFREDPEFGGLGLPTQTHPLNTEKSI
jgi:hypothetical protein